MSATKAFRQVIEVGSPEQKTAALLEVLRSTSDSELAKLKFWRGYVTEQMLAPDVLKDIPRERLEYFAELLLSSSEAFWSEVRALVKAGLISKPHSNGYTAGFIRHTLFRHYSDPKGVKEILLSDPEFLTGDLWSVFEFAGTAEFCLAGADKYYAKGNATWEATLCELAADGTIDRQRLLDESLNALSRDFNQYRAGWFSRFHEALKPTPEERTARLGKYVLLLNSAIPPTVSFATDALTIINKQSPISFDAIGDNCDTVLLAKSKQTAGAMLGILEECAKLDPTCKERVAEKMCNALASSSVDVQERALAFLAKLPNIESIQPTLDAYKSSISPSVKKKYSNLFASAADALSEVTVPAAVVQASGTTTVEALEDLDSVILKAAFVLENPTSYVEYEQVLGGICRLAHLTADDFGKRTSALLQRAKKLYPKTEDPLVRMLCHLIIIWLAKQPPEKLPTDRWVETTPLTEMHRLRIEEIIERVRQGTSFSLLSLPGDSYGWIEAEKVKSADKPGAPSQMELDALFCSVRERANPRDSEFEWSIVHTEREPYKFVDITMTPTPVSVVPCTLHNSFAKLISVRPNYARASYELGRRASVILLTGSLVPQYREVFYAMGASWLGHCMSYTDVDDKLTRHFFHFLHDPSVSPREMGHLMLALGMSMVDIDIATAARDGFAVLVEQGRLDESQLARCMHRLFHGGAVKLNRWNKNFGEVAKISPAHSRVVLNMVEQVLCDSTAQMPKDGASLLELFVELCAEHNHQPRQKTREYLSAQKGGGKINKLVRELLSNGSA